MLNDQCQTCQGGETFLDARTQQLQQELGSKASKLSDGMSNLEFTNCKPCWFRAVEQAGKIAYENGVKVELADLPFQACYDYVKQGLAVVKGWYDSVK